MKKSIILIALALMFFGAMGAVGAFTAFNFATLEQYEEMVDSTEKVDSTKKTENKAGITNSKAGSTSSKVSDEELILATEKALDFRLRCIRGIFACMCLITAGCIIYAIMTVLEQRVC